MALSLRLGSIGIVSMWRLDLTREVVLFSTSFNDVVPHLRGAWCHISQEQTESRLRRMKGWYLLDGMGCACCESKVCPPQTLNETTASVCMLQVVLLLLMFAQRFCVALHCLLAAVSCSVACMKWRAEYQDEVDKRCEKTTSALVSC